MRSTKSSKEEKMHEAMVKEMVEDGVLSCSECGRGYAVVASCDRAAV